jgi:uncharacterized protein YqiB (DUF1249 family)
MRLSTPLDERLGLTDFAPTVGRLMALCEENYLALKRLAPDLERMRGPYISRADNGADLLLEVREQGPYTTIFRLTHLFAGPLDNESWRPEPDAALRAYHDAAQVEVLDLRQTALPVYSHYSSPALQAKWKANLFLAKWLSYCLLQAHRFPPVDSPRPPRRERELLSTP